MAIAALSAASAQAATISYNDSIPLSSTNWNSSVSIPLFNPGLGTLTSIDFYLEGYVEGSAKFESLDAAPATITMNLAANINLQRPDLSNLAVVLPLAATIDNVTAHDGVIDFGGTSGKTYPMLSDLDSTTTSSPPPLSDLVLFTGIGNILLPVSAMGSSSGSGAGNLLQQFNTSASAFVEVTYHYDVPEPATISLLGLGALALIRRRR
jgi:hypothetical protein